MYMYCVYIPIVYTVLVPVLVQCSTVRVRTVLTYCTNVLYVHTVRRYCIELQYQPEGDSQLT